MAPPREYTGGALEAWPWLRVGGSLASTEAGVASCLSVEPAPLETTRKPSVQCGKLSGLWAEGLFAMFSNICWLKSPRECSNHLLSSSTQVDKDGGVVSSERVRGWPTLRRGPASVPARGTGGCLGGHRHTETMEHVRRARFSPLPAPPTVMATVFLW